MRPDPRYDKMILVTNPSTVSRAWEERICAELRRYDGEVQAWLTAPPGTPFPEAPALEPFPREA